MRLAHDLSRPVLARDAARILALPADSDDETRFRLEFVSSLPPALREEGLIAALSSPDSGIARTAPEQLRRSTGADLEEVREWESWWLVHRGPDVLASLRDLSSADAARRARAAGELGDHPLGIVREALERRRDDPDPAVREAVERALETSGKPDRR